MTAGSAEITSPDTPPLLPPRVTLPISRAKAWRRAATLLVPAAALIAFAINQAMGLNLRPSAYSNRVPEYAWLIVYFAIALAGARMAWQGVYWALVAGWPHDLGITLDADQWTVELGPMGRRNFDSKRVVVRYPDDDPEAGEDGLMEALKDRHGYRANYLPRLSHPATKDRLDQVIRHLTAFSEPELARQLLPFVNWKRSKDGLEEAAGRPVDE